MQTYLITGNGHKLKELEAILPKELKLASCKLDLDEIQSLDLHQIVERKLEQAYAIMKDPVIVEDVSAELESLNGLPGPFVKFFEEKLGKGALYKLGGEGDRVRIVCTMGYFNGKKKVLVEGEFSGTITASRGVEGFGFDFSIIPDGYEKTMSELGIEVKNTISHRFRAAQELAAVLRSEKQDGTRR